MAAEITKRGNKSCGMVVRPQAVSDPSYMESVVGFVTQSYSNSRNDEKEVVQWVKLEHVDISDIGFHIDGSLQNENTLPMLVIVGYTNGVQIWCILANGDAQEVLSLRQGPIKVLKILPIPHSVFNQTDLFASKRPLIAMSDSSSAGGQFCSVNIMSVKSIEPVASLSFNKPVVDILANKKVLVISHEDKITIFNAYNFKEKFHILNVYPLKDSPNLNPLALGSQWLAYADKKLVPLHHSSGGMATDGVQSYTAAMFHAAKTLGKGLSKLSETVANSLSGSGPYKTGVNNSYVKKDSQDLDESRHGVITILDVSNDHTGEIILDELREGIIAHFIAHANEPISFIQFDPSGTLLITAGLEGRVFNIFRVLCHPGSPALGAVHHVYNLHRGETTGVVQNVAFSLDSRWVAVSTFRGTTHIFPISPYGGQICMRTHTSARMVNKLSNFHKSAGLPEEMHLVTPVTTGSSPSGRTYDSHPSLNLQSGGLSARMGNPRLPPYPHPLLVSPLHQLKNAYKLSSHNSTKDSRSNRLCSTETGILICAMFAPPRAWVIGSPNLAREKRDKRPVDSLFVITCQGVLCEHSIEPKALSSLTKIADDSPIEIEVVSQIQWNLIRSPNNSEIKPPLQSSNLLMQLQDIQKSQSRSSLVQHSSEAEESEELWLSQVEIITHAGPHRRLWMGPQFSFRTFQQPNNTTVLTSQSSALLSRTPPKTPPPHGIYTERLDIESFTLHPTRSDPMPMPGHLHTLSEEHSLFLIEANSGSFDQSSGVLEVCGSWPDGTIQPIHQSKEAEERLRATIADAMIETHDNNKLDTNDMGYEELMNQNIDP